VSSDPSQENVAGQQFFDAQAAEIAHNYGRGRAIVAVDGAVGAVAFGRELVAGLVRAGHASVFASIDDFVKPPTERTAAQPVSSAYYYDERYDYATFRRVLVDPFRLGGSAAFVAAAFDEGASRPIEPVWRTAPADAVLVVAGPFLARPELRGTFNYTIFLETPARSQNVALDEALDRYTAEAQPRFSATAIVDTTDPERPRRVFADSC
jgi:uridine kinase